MGVPYRLVAVAIFSLLLGSFLHSLYSNSEMSKVLLKHATEKQELAEANEKAINDVIHKEHQLGEIPKRIANEGRKRIVEQKAAAVRLDDVAGELRDHVARDISEGTCSKGATAGERSEADTQAAMVRAELYRSVDKEAVELAKLYDSAYATGLACERQYDEVTSQKND